MTIWYFVFIFSGFGTIYQEKSGNPDPSKKVHRSLLSLRTHYPLIDLFLSGWKKYFDSRLTD
jgi:hypothetical protein